MRRPSRLALAAFGTVAIVVAGLVVGGLMIVRWLDPPSPTTTVTADDGSEVVLDWADYPADTYEDPQDVIDAPRAEDAPDVGAAEQEALADAVDAVTPGLEWQLEIPDGESFEIFPPVGGNGYGGDSLHATYNSPTDLGTGLAADADWHAIAAALDAELAALGYDPIQWGFDREPYDHETDAERDADVVAAHGSLDPDEMWMWHGVADRGSMWVSISIWDQRIPTTPDEPVYDEPAGVSIFMGGTVLFEDDAEAYAEGVAPFEGLERPEPTHSE